MVFCAIASTFSSGTDTYKTELLLSVINSSFAGVWFFILAITLFVAIRNPHSEYSIEKKSIPMIAGFSVFLFFAIYMFISQAYTCTLCIGVEGSLINWNIKGFSIVSTILLLAIVIMIVPGLILSVQIYKRSSGNYVG